jgi:catechol 2,3-dioxygenase-like lactoylglutathione lyase family enzyme
MLLDVTLGTSDLEKAAGFYDAVLATLGHMRRTDAPTGWAGWGPEDATGFWICRPYDARPASVGNGTMFSFAAKDAAEVRAFHLAALAHGGRDEGAPGTRDRYDPAFYVAYIRDLDGHKICAAFVDYDPAEDIA